MNLTRPMQATFVVALALAIFALFIFLRVVNIPDLPPFWVMTAAFVVLAAGNAVKGL